MFVRYIGPYRPFVDQIYDTGLWTDLRQVRPVPNEAGRAMVANHPDVYEAVGPVPPEGVPDFANVWQRHVEWAVSAAAGNSSHVFMALPPGLTVVDVTVAIRTNANSGVTMDIGYWDTADAVGAAGDADYWFNNESLDAVGFARQRYGAGNSRQRRAPFLIEGAQGKHLVGTLGGTAIAQPTSVVIGVEAVLY